MALQDMQFFTVFRKELSGLYADLCQYKKGKFLFQRPETYCMQVHECRCVCNIMLNLEMCIFKYVKMPILLCTSKQSWCFELLHKLIFFAVFFIQHLIFELLWITELAK